MAKNLGIPVAENDYYFISYNTEDANRVSKIVQLMHHHKIPMWYDRGIKYGKEWEEEIASHVRKSKAVLIFLTKGVFQKTRPYVPIEYEMAKIRNRPIYIIFLDEIEYDMVPDSMLRWFIDITRLQNIQHTLVNDSENLMKEIARMLGITLQKTASNQSAADKKVGKIENGDIIDPEKQVELGTDYYYGINGVQQNFVEAVRWFYKAASQGNAVAQYKLGECYEYGRGVSQSYEEGAKWYRKAAENGHSDAQYDLGMCYEYGHGVVKNYEKAVEWYRRSSDLGNVYAQCSLGFCYEVGKGVAQNNEEAVKWYRKTAEQGLTRAQYNLALCYEYGRGVAKNSSEALKWYQKAADQGDEDAKKKVQTLLNSKEVIK